MRSSFSYSSRCDRTETHSPDAIENAPATSPATPASTTMDLLDVPPATPMTSEKFETSPSLTPKTVARSAPPIPARCRPSAAAIRPPAVLPPRIAATTLPCICSWAAIAAGAAAMLRYLSASAASARSTIGSTASVPTRRANRRSTRMRNGSRGGLRSTIPASRIRSAQ